jgi:DNA (cytosine-5)-methyltransferase 1
MDIFTGDDGGMRELALFAGAGGGILGGLLLGWRTVCAVELDAYAASILIARQNDGLLSPFPVWDDVRTFDGRPWRGIVDVISGGFPCQDISAAGRGAGIDGERSGLWKEFARIIGEVRPRHVLVENSPMLTVRGLGRVLGDLASLGFDARWGVLGAVDAGAPHQRERIWIVAHTERVRQLQSQGRKQAQWQRTGDGSENESDIDGERLETPRAGLCKKGASSPWSTEPDVVRMVYGMAATMDRIKALGNGQVPAVVRLAWEILSKPL